MKLDNIEFSIYDVEVVSEPYLDYFHYPISNYWLRLDFWISGKKYSTTIHLKNKTVEKEKKLFGITYWIDYHVEPYTLEELKDTKHEAWLEIIDLYEQMSTVIQEKEKLEDKQRTKETFNK